MKYLDENRTIFVRSTSFFFTLMENQMVEYHSVIKFRVSKRQSPIIIYKHIIVVYDVHATSRRVVFEWVRCFKHGQLNIEDNSRSDQPITPTDDQTVETVEVLIIEDRRITIQQIDMTVGVSTYTEDGIIHDQLHMSKVSSRWIPHLVTPDQRHEHVQSCQELLARYSADDNDFLFIII